MRLTFALFGLAALAVGCSSGSGSDANQPVSQAEPKTSSKAVTLDCYTRSMANFGPAFTDPKNLVVGPLLLVGGAEATSEALIRAHEGQKFPLLVQARHSVRVSVPVGARRFAGLAYGPFPEGEIRARDAHDVITFVACDRDEPSGSKAGGPVTFWSGFVMTSVPTCLPLDVHVDGASTPRRVEIALGADCDSVPAAVARA
jgi:hypothetical protein